jgi:hypothetical protein
MQEEAEEDPSKLGDESDSDASTPSGSESDGVLKRRCSLSLPIALFVLLLNVTAAGGMLFCIVSGSKPSGAHDTERQRVERSGSASEDEFSGGTEYLVSNAKHLNFEASEDVQVHGGALLVSQDGKIIRHLNASSLNQLDQR